MDGKVDVLIVDDSLFIRNYLAKILATYSIIGEVKTAIDGVEALALLSTYKPHIITLDVEMPRMNGLETLKAIKQKYGIPVLMISSLTRKGADTTIKALELGAFDWLQKPDNAFDLVAQEELKKDLFNKIAYITNKKELIGEIVPQEKIQETTPRDPNNITNLQFKEMVITNGWKPSGNLRLSFNIIAIGISTGGPSALNQVIPFLPKDINAAVIIVQHMPATFTKVLAERLNDISQVNVKEAEEDDVLEKGCVFVIPGDKHVRLREVNGRVKISLDSFAKVGGFKPSAENLFYFTAEIARKNAIGIIMTGMGGDGSDNIGMIKRYSNKTIAQDEASCVIFGMPKVAIKKGNIDFIVPLNKIVDKIKELL